MDAPREPRRVVAVFWCVFSLLTACAASRTSQTLEAGHLIVSRKIADLVDRVDRAFGDPRVEDRERKVKVATGVDVTAEEGGKISLHTRLEGRIPIPSLERRANIFLGAGGDVDREGDIETQQLGPSTRSYDAFLQYLNVQDWPISYGFRIRVLWHGLPQIVAGPYLRWETQFDSLRLCASQEVNARSADGFQGLTIFHVDHPLGATSFLRFSTDLEMTRADLTPEIRNALSLNQAFGEYGALSHGVGVRYRPDDFGQGVSFAQVRWVGRFWRPWLEYRLSPIVSVPWRSGDPAWRFLVGFRVIFEQYLRQ